MELAIEEMESCASNGPKVGAVLIKNGHVIGRGHKEPSIHAERAAIDSATMNGHDMSEAVLFTTLEPCVSLGGAQEPCSVLISRVGIKTVYIGRYDPNPQIHRLGWKALRDAGVTLRDFDADLRMRIDAINQTFIEHFISGVGPENGAKFDYQLNGGRFEVQFSPDDTRTITTRWTHRGKGSIYAYANRPVTVALAKYACDFAEVDDPTAFDFSYTVPVHEGEIAIFQSKEGALLVLVQEVNAGPPGGAGQRHVKIRYQVRPKQPVTA